MWIVNGGKDLGIQDEENIQHFTTSVFRFVNSLFLSGFFSQRTSKKSRRTQNRRGLSLFPLKLPMSKLNKLASVRNCRSFSIMNSVQCFVTLLQSNGLFFLPSPNSTKTDNTPTSQEKSVGKSSAGSSSAKSSGTSTPSGQTDSPGKNTPSNK